MSDDRLYDIARKITHDAGAPWTDPRTLVTHPPPSVPPQRVEPSARPWHMTVKAPNLITIGNAEGSIADVALWSYGVAGNPEQNEANARFIVETVNGAVNARVDSVEPPASQPERSVAWLVHDAEVCPDLTLPIVPARVCWRCQRVDSALSSKGVAVREEALEIARRIRDEAASHPRHDSSLMLMGRREAAESIIAELELRALKGGKP